MQSSCLSPHCQVMKTNVQILPFPDKMFWQEHWEQGLWSCAFILPFLKLDTRDNYSSWELPQYTLVTSPQTFHYAKTPKVFPVFQYQFSTTESSTKLILTFHWCHVLLEMICDRYGGIYWLVLTVPVSQALHSTAFPKWPAFYLVNFLLQCPLEISILFWELHVPPQNKRVRQVIKKSVQ